MKGSVKGFVRVHTVVTVALGLLAVAARSYAYRLHRADRPEWSQLGHLPDWGGLWTPVRQGARSFGIGDPTWTPTAAKQIEALRARDKAGNPLNVYIDCLPEGMPSFIVMTLNAIEILFTPGRVTILGEFDGNRLRRIYTDGRKHPEDPDLTFHGHSIGHWEGDTLVVDTTAILPQAVLPLGQSVALPNNGDMHITERIRLIEPDKLRFDLEVTAPQQLAKPWKVHRIFKRDADRKAEITEASCRQGDFTETTDANGNHIFAPISHDPGGAPLPIVAGQPAAALLTATKPPASSEPVPPTQPAADKKPL